MNIDFCTLQEWAPKNYRAMPSGPRIFLSARWVGHEKFSRKILFSSGPPPVINNDRSLNLFGAAIRKYLHPKQGYPCSLEYARKIEMKIGQLYAMLT